MKIVRARVLHDHLVQFTLDDGRKIERDFSLIQGRAFERTWRDPRKFKRVTVVDGKPTWPGKLEFSPEVILRGGCPGRMQTRIAWHALSSAHAPKLGQSLSSFVAGRRSISSPKPANRPLTFATSTPTFSRRPLLTSLNPELDIALSAHGE